MNNRGHYIADAHIVTIDANEFVMADDNAMAPHALKALIQFLYGIPYDVPTELLHPPEGDPLDLKELDTPHFHALVYDLAATLNVQDLMVASLELFTDGIKGGVRSE